MSISIEDILLRASEFPSDSLVYVVADFGDGAYVLVSNKQIIYAISSTGQQSTKAPTIKTDYLELCTAIKLRPVDHSGGKVDENMFDFIRLIDSASRSEALAFLRLCFVHAASNRDQTIEEFFSSISLLFVSTPEQSKKNAIGLFGELCIIDSLLDQGLDASPFWQISGVKTKYDFCFRELNLEVKTTPREEPMVQLKHSQLFNGDRNYLAFVQIEESPSGCSVLELAAKLKETGACFMGMRESMVLEKELLRIREEDQRIPYRVKSIEVYSAELINPFVEEIPDNVSRLEYMLNLVGQDSLEQSQIQYWVLQEGKSQAS